MGFTNVRYQCKCTKEDLYSHQWIIQKMTTRHLKVSPVLNLTLQCHQNSCNNPFNIATTLFFVLYSFGAYRFTLRLRKVIFFHCYCLPTNFIMNAQSNLINNRNFFLEHRTLVIPPLWIYRLNIIFLCIFAKVYI